MRLGVDASNIRDGGGVTHLVELLCASNPLIYGFSQVVVWGGKGTLNLIKDRPWLVKSHQPVLNKSLLHRTLWQRFRLSRLARTSGCDVLLVPGSSYAGTFRPIVTMSQNLLPFEWQELRRYGWSWMTLKLLLLRLSQSRTFRRADGLIFLTEYARDVVMRAMKTAVGKTTIVPHGVNKRFACPPRQQMPICQYSVDRPFRILYVSTVDMYKHQGCVAEAVAHLRRRGLPVVLDLVGQAYSPALVRLRQKLRRIDPAGEFVRYSGPILYDELPLKYAQAELCLFASTCENMPNILMESMISGLPIACSDRRPMPDVLGDAAIYFDPENPDSITLALRKLIDSPELRSRLAKISYERAKLYSWEQCAGETFGFISLVAGKARMCRARC